LVGLTECFGLEVLDGFVLWLSKNVKNVAKDFLPWSVVPFHLSVELSMCFKKNVFENNYTYSLLDMDHWSRMGGSTLMIAICAVKNCKEFLTRF